MRQRLNHVFERCRPSNRIAAAQSLFEAPATAITAQSGKAITHQATHAIDSTMPSPPRMIAAFALPVERSETIRSFRNASMPSTKPTNETTNPIGKVKRMTTNTSPTIPQTSPPLAMRRIDGSCGVGNSIESSGCIACSVNWSWRAKPLPYSANACQ